MSVLLGAHSDGMHPFILTHLLDKLGKFAVLVKQALDLHLVHTRPARNPRNPRRLGQGAEKKKKKIESTKTQRDERDSKICVPACGKAWRRWRCPIPHRTLSS